MNRNLILFGKTLENIRKKLGFTQNYVSTLSGINSETLRRIENGKVIPKFETLEFLSNAYKQDLNALFLNYRLEDYSYFYELRNRLEGKFDRDEFYSLNIELKELNMLINYINSPYYKNLINQLIQLTEAVILYKDNNNYSTALNALVETFKITIPTFSLDNYDSFIYSSMDIRILMNIAFVLNKLNDKTRYLEIMEFCINSIDSNDEIYPKLCHNLAGAFRRNKDFQKALDFSNTGITSCQKNRNFNGLNLLYYGKGIAEYMLNKGEYIESLKTSIYLCEAFGQDKLKNTIVKNCKEVFGIDL